MTTEEFLAVVTEHYLSQREYNGFPVRKLPLEHARVVELLEGLVVEEMISLSVGSPHPNPYVKALPPAPVDVQVDGLHEASDLAHVTVYPESKHLRAVVDPADYEGRPFTLRLALGASQLLPACFFDLFILETYRNDPRYEYRSNETGGSISVTDAYFQSDEMREADQILLETFGFGFNDQLHRVVAVFPIYLSRLSPEHQQIWAARELTGDYKLHPAYYSASIVGSFPDREPIFSAFIAELEQLTAMCGAVDLPPIVRETFAETKPSNFSFLLRPTLKELQEFHATLDKLMSDNLNKKFFAAQGIELESETTRADAMIEVRQRGTIALLEDWLGMFQCDDRSGLDEAVSVFREVRKLRQRPAHSLDDNVFDIAFYEAQRKLIVRAYNAVRLLRLVMANYPGLQSYDEVPDWLHKGLIYDY